MISRQQLGQSRRWVIKVGSSLITNGGRGLDDAFIADLVDQVAALTERGIEVVLVSSGAIAEGMKRLNWQHRPSALYELQAAASVGQMGLIQAYESHFKRHGMHTAQILLTHDDVVQRQRYLNARTTLRTLIKHRAVPVVNENDTVAVEEIRFGDNDTLAALVANLVEANLLVMLTDQAGMYDRDPRQPRRCPADPRGPRRRPALEAMAATGRSGQLWPRRDAHQGQGRRLGGALRCRFLIVCRGAAARTAGSGGRQGRGDLLRPRTNRLAARKQWLAGRLKVAGKAGVG